VYDNPQPSAGQKTITIREIPHATTTESLIESVEKAASVKEARMVAEAVAGSLLVKTALHGGDPNWGRIIAAVGYSGAPVSLEKMTLYFGRHCAYRRGLCVKNMERKLAAEMRKKKVTIRLLLGRGKAQASMLFCDIGHDYVTLNSDYRT